MPTITQSYRIAAQIRSIYRGRFSESDGYYPSDPWPFITSQWEVGGLITTPEFRVQIGNTGPAFILFRGVTSATGRDLYAGWVRNDEVVANGGFNAASWRDANAVVNYCNNHPRIRGRTLVIGGHSAGGCIAEAMLRIYAESTPGRVEGIYTYGEPCAGIQGAYAFDGDAGKRTNWIAVGDPVPMLPYTRVGNRFFAIIGNDFDRLILNAWRQPSRISLIGVNGQYGAGDFRSEEFPYTDQDIFDWWGGVENAAEHPHSINTYYNRLAEAIRIGVPSGTFPPPYDEAAMEALERRLAEWSRSSGASEGAEIFSMIGPDGVSPIPSPGNTTDGREDSTLIGASRLSPGLTPTIKVSGGKWKVFWLGRLVATCDTASRAKRIAVRIRTLCRSLSGAFPLNADGLVLGFKEFTMTGSVPNQGVNPRLVVG